MRSAVGLLSVQIQIKYATSHKHVRPRGRRVAIEFRVPTAGVISRQRRKHVQEASVINGRDSSPEQFNRESFEILYNPSLPNRTIQ